MVWGPNDPFPNDPERPPDFKAQGEQLAVGATEPVPLTRVGKMLVGVGETLFSRLVEFLIRSASWIAVKLAGAVMKAEDRSEGAFRDLTHAAIKDLTGVDAGAGAGGIGRALMESLAGGPGAAPGGNIEPSTRGAEAYMEMVMKLALEGYVEGGITSTLSLGYLDKFTELDDILANVLGLGRMSRAVMRPMMTARVVTPAQWHVNRTYRPELLSPSDAIRQYLRGNWSHASMVEELARQGFSEARIDALVNAQQKFFSPSDVRQFVERQHWTQDQGLQHLRDQGYEEPAAVDLLRLEGLKIFESHEAAEASTIINAYASHDIERAQFLALLTTYVEVPSQRALAEEIGELRRQLNIKRLSSSQAAACVRAKVLAYVDYRRALEREGYDAEAITALEILLRVEIDKDRTAEQHRLDLERERAQEKALRAEAAAARKAEIDHERAVRRRGPIAELERAAVRGLIPFARVEEVLTTEYDADTVAIIVAGIEVDRQRYLEQLGAADEARKRAARRNVDVGALEAAVFANLLTVEEFTQRLIQLHFDPADAALLATTLRARKADLDAAKRKRDEAEAAARRKRIDLGRFERLVRLGARSMADYDALLDELGFDDASRAAMIDLLNREIAQDRAADEKRAAAEARLRNKGLSLEQFRRAVILGNKTVDQYGAFLVNEGFTADTVATLVAEVERAVADAAAARARRDSTPARAEEPALPLSTIARAARLGIIAPSVYQDRLVAAGYSADDVAIDMELLMAEIADIQAARTQRAQAEPAAVARGLSLAQLAAAVKKGVSSIEDYRARAITLGYALEDVTTLVELLRAELELLKDATARRALIEDALAARQISLAQLEEQVTSGSLTIDAYAAELERLGIAPADIDLLAALLVRDLGGTSPDGP